jgi:cell division protein FtsL
MHESLPSKTEPKMMVKRNVVVALVLICIVLIALIAYFAVTLSQTQADNANLARKIAQQNSTISQLESNITDLQNQIAIANATIASLSTVKIASVRKTEGHSSTGYVFSFTLEVTDNGTVPVNRTIAVINLYHDWMNISFPVNEYTNEVQGYYFNGSYSNNILYFGSIPAGGNETHTIYFAVFDSVTTMVGGTLVPINYAVATVYLGNIILDEQTLQFNQSSEQTWVFP